MSSAFKRARFLFNFFDTARLDFYEDFAAALADNATDSEQLKKMAARSRMRRTGWAPLYEHWLKKMRRMSFAHALAHTVPDQEVMVLTAAEEDARLPKGMHFLARAIRSSSAIKAAYFMSLISPALGSVTVLGFFAAYALLIAPILQQVIPTPRWPPMSSLLYTVSTGIVHHALALAVGLIAIVLCILWTRPNWKGPLRAKFDRLSCLPWKSYRRNQSIHFLMSLAILLQGNHHGMKEALERMRALASPWLAWHITRMLKRLKLTPDIPAKALDTGFFEPKLMDRIEDYSERSDFFAALTKLAFDQSDRFLKQAERRAIFGGFVALLMVATVVMFIVFANYEMNQAIESSAAAFH